MEKRKPHRIELGIIDLLSELEPEPGKIKRQCMDYFQFIILYLMKSIAGIKGMNPCEDLLFTDEFAMRLVQFNGRQVHHGINKRGLDKGERGNSEIRGIINNDTLANNIEKVNLVKLNHRFDKVIHVLAKEDFFPKFVDLTLDCTDIETTKSFPGCGVVKKKKAVKKKAPIK